MEKVISKVKKNNTIKIMNNNTNLLLKIKNIFGGQSKSIPEKLNNNLNKMLDENSNLKNKKSISQIIDDITPIILKYQQNINKYHDTLVNRDTLKKSLQEAFIKLRNFEQTFSDTKYKLADQGDSIKANIEKIQTIIKQMENDQKPQDLIDEIKNHKLKLIDFLNTRGNYIQKVEQLNDTLIQRKNSLNTSKTDVRNKLKELQTIGTNLDEIKEELESHTNMYGGNILNKAILKTKIQKDDYLRYLTNPIEYIIKGGNKKISILKNQWKQDQSDYIFNNFEFDDLKTIATKWGISNIDKFKNKKDLGIALKLILYIKTGLNTDFKSLVLVSHFLDIDISDVDKHDIGEIIQRINKKTTNIPFNNDIQIGGAAGALSDDVIRFVDKNSSHAVSSKIIVHIPSSFKDFKTKIDKITNMKIIAQKLEDSNQLKSQSVTKMKNGIYDGSHTVKILKLEDITNPKDFANLAGIKKWWIEGSYLNNSAFNKTETLYPAKQYIAHTGEAFVNFVNLAIHSLDSIIAIKDIMETPVEVFGSQLEFDNILQKHVNQLINLKSTNLTRYVQNLHSNKYTNIKVFTPVDTTSFKDLLNKKKLTAAMLKTELNRYFIQPDKDSNANKNYQKHKKANLPKIIAKETFENGDEEEKRIEGLITGQIIGYSLNKLDTQQTYLNLDDLQFVIYNKFYKNPNHNKDYHNQKNKQTDPQQSHTIKNVFNKDIEILSMSQDKTKKILNDQTGGHKRILEIIKDTQEPSLIKGIVPHLHPTKKSPKTLSEISPYNTRDPKSKELMDNAELENHINRIGNLLLEIKKDASPFNPKTKVGIFNVIGDSDDSNVIDRSTLLGYLTAIETWLNNYKPTEAQVIELYQIIDYIRKFYKGNDFDAVIKSQKIQLLENLNKLRNINKTDPDDHDKHIPKMKSKIDDFINNFQLALQEYDQKFFSIGDNTNTKDLLQFITQQDKNSKGYLFEQHVNKLKKVFCKIPTGTCKINNKAFPVDNKGQNEIIEFISFVQTAANQAKDIENDIIFIEATISKLEELEQIFGQQKIKDITEYVEKIGQKQNPKQIISTEKQVIQAAKNIKLSQLQQQLLYEKDYNKHLKTENVDKMINNLNKQYGGVQSGVLLTVSINDTFLKIIQTAKQEFKDLKDKLIKKYKEIGSEGVDLDNDTPNITEFVIEYLVDISKYIKGNYTASSKNNTLEDYISNNVHTHWEKLMDHINAKQKAETTHKIVAQLGKRMKNTKARYSSDGQSVMIGGTKTPQDIPSILNSLTSSIHSSYRKEFLNTEKKSIQKAVIDSNINDRFSQLKEVAKLRRAISKDIVDDSIPSQETQNVLEHLKSLDLLIRDNYVIDNEYKTSENVYTLIDENNPDLELPEYHLISHLQFTIMVGFVNKFEKIWKSDESFHGKYETYINKLLNGSIFEEKNKSKHFDIGNINDDKFLRAYYSDLTEYIKTNEINSFENFLHQTYTKIFSSSESPNDGYNEFWGKTMYDIGIEWEDLRESPDYNGLIPSADLFGSEENILSSFEQGLLFSFIIHAKDLINEESEEIIQLNPRQKFNKFIKFLPQDTLSYMVITLDSLFKNNQTGGVQTGGAWKFRNHIKQVDGKHEIPGKFFFHKNLDNIKHLYIFQHKDGKDKECKISPLYPEDKKLVKKLQLPLKKDFKQLHRWTTDYKQEDIDFKNTVGLTKQGKYESILLPNRSQQQTEIKKCAEYRLTNTGKKYKGFSIWEFEKKDFKGDFIPLILWTGKELNKLEKAIISDISTSSNKIFQNKKYEALIQLIEKGDFGTYFDQKKILTLNSQFDKLTKKSTNKFWERNFPKFNKLRKDSKNSSPLKKNIQTIIGNIIFELQKNKQTAKKNLTKHFKITLKNNLQIDFYTHNFVTSTYGPHNFVTSTYGDYEEYIKEIKEWIDDVEKLVNSYKG